jgi:hypothetical protein
LAQTDTRPAVQLTLMMVMKACFIPAYLVLSLILFFAWVNPSLTGDNDHHIAADSRTYMYFAESLREGRNDPLVIAALASFPNTLWAPVLLGLVLKSTVSIVVADYVLLLLSVWLLHKALHLEVGLFLILLFANVTTFISLISLNKEIIDLFALSLFVYYLARRKRMALFAALLISLVSRYETCVVMLVYLALQSRWNHFRRFRKSALIVLVLLLSVVLSSLLSGAMAQRMEEAQDTAGSGGLLLLLDNLQIHYLFFLAVIPKILDNLFAGLINVNQWADYSWDDPANSFFLFGNNLANLGILVFLFLKGRLNLRNDLVYYACLSSIFMSLALIIQPRYFYGAYILLCAEAARRQVVPGPVEGMRGIHAAT